MHSPPMENRFAVRPDPRGFSVYDQTTGDTLVIAAASQSGLSFEDAEHTAAVFNQAPAPVGSTAH
jgi:hypothetical protein